MKDGSDASNQTPIVVLGGGISGLATAWFLKKAGIPFKLFEKNTRTGGKIKSDIQQGTVLDYGPNSIRDTYGDIRKLANELSISDDLIEISEAFKNRFIVKKGRLCGISPKITSLITTDILSTAGKLWVLSEPFISKGKSGDESIGAFLERRIGKEAVDYLVDPVLSGIYAGHIYRMSKNSVLANLSNFEQEFGSIAWGVIRAKKEKRVVKPKVISFRKGLQQLTDELTHQLSEDTIYGEVTSVNKVEEGFKITTAETEIVASKVISCLPAYVSSDLLKPIDLNLAEALSEIEYAPMLSTQVIYEAENASVPKSGFGFLIPRKENYRLLGAIWKSEIFPSLSPPERKHFILMTGGAHDPAVLNDSIEEIEQQIIGEFSQLMNISEKPSFVKSQLWPKAIPQFNVGFSVIKQEIQEAENRHPGLHIVGNYRWGISVPDCVKGAKKFVENITL